MTKILQWKCNDWKRLSFSLMQKKWGLCGVKWMQVNSVKEANLLRCWVLRRFVKEGRICCSSNDTSETILFDNLTSIMKSKQEYFDDNVFSTINDFLLNSKKIYCCSRDLFQYVYIYILCHQSWWHSSTSSWR